MEIYSLLRNTWLALDEQAEEAAVVGLCKHQSPSTLYFECAVKAAEIAKFSPETEEDRTVHMEMHRKPVASAVIYALELSESFLLSQSGGILKRSCPKHSWPCN